MNIFILDSYLPKSAEYHCDKHVTKMIVETAQLISFACHLRGNTFPHQYKPNKMHMKHPCTLWAAASSANITYLSNLGTALFLEYSNRYYNRVPADKYLSCRYIFAESYHLFNLKRDDSVMTEFAQAMPDQYKVPGDAVKAYRNYYINGKQHLHTWTNRQVPDWISVHGLGTSIVRVKK